MSNRRFMDLRTVFKLSLYGLTALVGAILGCAESEGVSLGHGRVALSLPFLSIPLVVCGYLFTERSRHLNDTEGAGLSTNWANLLGFVALCATLYEFTREGHERKLLAGTHLLLYATWIVLFQKKTVRLYWFLMALGVLQLAVSSVLTSKGWFGFCAICYMFAAVWTLSIFSLWRAEQQFEEQEKERLERVKTSPQSAQAAVKLAPYSQGEVRGTVQHEFGTQWITGRFVTGVMMTSFSALIVSAAFFAFVPRMWVGATVSMNSDQDTIPGLGSRTGLSSTVRLGDLGPILESMDRVFEIQFKLRHTDKIISAQEYAERLGMAEPLFRALVMNHYENGRWGFDPYTNYMQEPFKRGTRYLEVQQEVRLDSNVSGVLYCLGLPMLINDMYGREYGSFNQINGVAQQGDGNKEHGMVIYAVYSSLPKETPMQYGHPVSPATEEAYNKIHYLARCGRLPRNLRRLKELTFQIIEEETERRKKAENRVVPRKLKPIEVASAIEAYLRDSGRYRYSLDQSIQDANIDPIEDFLFNRKEGHCEYFATALALMLRAADIPTRIVTGYKGGIVRTDRKDWLEVQQRFAHAWVEAWIGDHKWTTFDATPVDERSTGVMAVAAKKGSLWSDMQSTLSGLWSDNVLNMSLDRQEQSIYRPMRELAQSAMTTIRNFFQSPASAFRSLIELLSKREQWLSVGGGLTAFILMLMLAGFVWLVRRVVRFIRAWLASRLDQRIHNRHRFIEFYERFVNVIKAHGLTRAITQTQGEFAEMVASAYSPELAAVGQLDLPQQISHLYYQVRFGEQDLTESEISHIEEMITQMEQIVTDDQKGSKALA